MKSTTVKSTKRLLDLLFPPRCIFCGGLAPPDDPRQCCRRCAETVPRTDGVLRREAPALCAAPFKYLGGAKRALRRLKFYGRTSYAAPLAYFMAGEARRMLPTLPEVVVWAPVSAGRLRERGYDQSQLLAQEAAALLALPVVPALKKVRETPPQSSLKGYSSRLRNISGAYVCCDPAAVRGKTVLLVDDIRTTGATVSECARVLHGAGAVSVNALTVCFAGKENS